MQHILSRLLLPLLTILLFTAATAEAEEVDSHRQAAEEVIKAYEVKSLEERGRDLALTLIRGGLAPAENLDALSEKLARLLGSAQFIDIVADSYMKQFTEEELTGIAESLRTPAMQKFLSSRFGIVQESMSRIGELFDEFEIAEELHGP